MLKDQIFHEMCAALGGRAAEQIVFGEISTGALSDLEKVTKQATSMIVVYGLNDKIGNVSYYDSSGANEYALTKPYSEKTAETIDAEVRIIIEEAYVVAKNILTEHKESLGKLARLLLEKEVIFKEDLEAIFGTRPGEESAEEKNDDVDKKIDAIVEEQELKESEVALPAEETSSKEVAEQDDESDSAAEKKPPLQINLDF